ncbi:MAG: hypothetical protein IJJ38_02100 [Lachnospiraceae bacterium]|nr:hypothetical protein [Lachnospiraceae bacterium]
MTHKKTPGVVIVICICLVLCSCGSSGTDEVRHKSKEEIEIGYYHFEGIFLSTEEVTEAFRSSSDEFPRYPVVPETFHITTEYMPETTHENLYGTEVTVHITGYKYGTSTDETDGSTSENEGFKVEVTSQDPKMQELLNSIHKTWHITGSYTTAARYTKYMDFSDAEPVDFMLTGTFGWSDSDNNLVLTRPQP